MPIVPNVCVHQGKIQAGVDTAKRNLAPDVVGIDYRLGEDWSGDPAVFFRIVLSDEASNEIRLKEIIWQVPAELYKDVNPIDLGLYP